MCVCVRVSQGAVDGSCMRVDVECFFNEDLLGRLNLKMKKLA